MSRDRGSVVGEHNPVSGIPAGMSGDDIGAACPHWRAAVDHPTWRVVDLCRSSPVRASRSGFVATGASLEEVEREMRAAIALNLGLGLGVYVERKPRAGA